VNTMGALLNKSSAKKDADAQQQPAAAAGPSEEPKPETAENAVVGHYVSCSF